MIIMLIDQESNKEQKENHPSFSLFFSFMLLARNNRNIKLWSLFKKFCHLIIHFKSIVHCYKTYFLLARRFSESKFLCCASATNPSNLNERPGFACFETSSLNSLNAEIDVMP